VRVGAGAAGAAMPGARRTGALEAMIQSSSLGYRSRKLLPRYHARLKHM
jgi:hypothetical protein